MIDQKAKNENVNEDVNGKEIWAEIKGYEGQYSVSNWGRVRSEDRTIKTKFFNKKGLHIKEKILVFRCNPKGYPVVNLRDSTYVIKNPKTVEVHKLVMAAFGPPKPNDGRIYEMDHKNIIKTDNHIRNLRWLTKTQNQFNTKPQLNNVSGFKGIHIIKGKNKKYRAKIQRDGIRYSLGEYHKLEDAIAARKEGELKYYPEMFQNL